jgi:hypothetical protein
MSRPGIAILIAVMLAPSATHADNAVDVWHCWDEGLSVEPCSRFDADSRSDGIEISGEDIRVLALAAQKTIPGAPSTNNVCSVSGTIWYDPGAVLPSAGNCIDGFPIGVADMQCIDNQTNRPPGVPGTHIGINWTVILDESLRLGGNSLLGGTVETLLGSIPFTVNTGAHHSHPVTDVFARNLPIVVQPVVFSSSPACFNPGVADSGDVTTDLQLTIQRPQPTPTQLSPGDVGFGQSGVGIDPTLRVWDRSAGLILNIADANAIPGVIDATVDADGKLSVLAEDQNDVIWHIDLSAPIALELPPGDALKSVTPELQGGIFYITNAGGQDEIFFQQGTSQPSPIGPLSGAKAIAINPEDFSLFVVTDGGQGSCPQGDLTLFPDSGHPGYAARTFIV